MSKQNYINYQVELTEANASIIEQINVLLIPGYPGNADPPSKSSNPKITMSTLKKAVTAAKKDHDISFVNACIEVLDGTTSDTLAKNVASIDQDKWPAFIAALEAGPTDSDVDFDEEADDEFEDDEIDEIDEIDANAVKLAVRAHAKEHGRDAAKALMKKHKVNSLSDINDLSTVKLIKLMKAVA